MNKKSIAVGALAVVFAVGWIFSTLRPAAAIAANDGILFYGASANTNPQVRAYSPSVFGSASGTVSGTQALATVIKTSPTKYEAVAGYVDSSGLLQIMCFNGSSWSNEWSVTVGGSGTRRPFDIAYENTSGKVMVLYGNNGANLAYRTKPNSSACGTANWSGATTVTPARTAGTIQWVKLAADKRASSNILAAAWADNASDLSSQTWSGSAWGNEPTVALSTGLDFVTTAQDTDSFDLEYESTSGDLMLVWGTPGAADATQLIKYATCTGGTASCNWDDSGDGVAVGPVEFVTTVADGATTIDISANPLNNQMAMGAIDKNALANSCDLSGALWNGGGSGNRWSGLSNIDSGVECPTAGQKTVSTFFLTNGANTRWILNYDDSTGNGVQYRSYNGITAAPAGLQSYNPTTSLTDVRARYESVLNPFNNNEAMVLMANSVGALFVKKVSLDGSGVPTWSDPDGNASLGTLGQAPVGDFSYEYWRYIPNPSYTQSAYRWYANADSVTPGSALANENTAHTLTSIASPVRLRTQLTLATDPQLASTQAFKLQYATSTSGPWTDVGAGGGDTWCSDNTGVTCNTSWASRRKITLNNSASSTNLADFSLLVKLNSSRIDYSKTQNAGQDIRFVDPADPTVVLPHEIESWNESGDSYVWVKVPQIDSGSTTDYIWMYYDNALASDGQAATSVWDANYKGVWHNEEATGTTLSDSTSNANTATKVSSTNPNPGAGQVDGAQVYNGSSSQATAPDSASLDMTGTMTISAWVNLTSITDWRTVACKDDTFQPNYCMQMNADKFVFSYYAGGFEEITSVASLSTGAWYHLAATYDDTANQVKLYINGVLDSTTTVSTSLSTTGSVLDFGHSAAGEWFSGTVDQVELSSNVRSADWIKAEYVNQNDSMNSFGSEQDQSSSGTAPWGFYNNATPSGGATLSSNVLTGTDVSETYQESNPTPVNPNAINVGGQAEWDFSLDPAGAVNATTYYFRMVKSDGTALSAYTHYPQVTISTPSGPTLDQQMRGGQSVINGVKQPFSF